MQENESSTIEGHIFKKNMAAIANIDRELYTWLHYAQADPAMSLLTANDGSANLVIRPSHGNQILYYGDPPSVKAEFSVIHGMDLTSGSMTCLVGMGMGYTVKAILEKMDPGHHLMVLEPNSWLLRLALNQVDIADSIRTDNLHIVRPDQKAVENLFLRLLSKGILRKKLKIIVDPRSEAISDEYKRCGKQIEEAYSYANVLIENATRVGKRSIQNEIENTIIVALSPGLEILKPLIKGKPVLLVGAGPSLDRSIEKIKQAQEKMFIFSFAASWRNLLSNGIDADFVVTTDKNIESFGMLKYTRFAQQIPLIFSSPSHPEFIKKYLGPRYAVPQKALYPMLPSHKNHSVSLGTGTSVAVFAFNLAAYLEADPVVLIGLDLAVGDVTHADGHHFRGRLNPDDPRLIKIPGVHNTTARTFPHLTNTKRHLECYIESSEVRPINATLSGARIEGTLEMDIDEVCQSLPDLSKKRPSILSLSLEAAKEKLPVSGMAVLSRDVRNIIEICTHGIKALKEFNKKLKKGQVDESWGIQMNQTGRQIQDFLVKNPLINDYVSDIWLKLKRERNETSYIRNPAKRVCAEIVKNLEAFKKIRSELEGILERIAVQQREMAKIESYPHFLFDNGFFNEACLEFEKIADKGLQACIPLAELKARMGLLSRATSLLEEKELNADEAGRKTRPVVAYIEKEKENLIKEAQEIIQSSSRIDVYLMYRELARSLPNDAEAEEMKQRLSEIAQNF